ncbi:MAG: RecX family transcriptional regulator [Candidatus Roizmanbacteria bacterium]
MIEDQIKSALQCAYRYLSYRNRSRHEVELYLQKKAELFHWELEVVEKAVVKLELLGYVNDKEFVKTYVSQRLRIKSRSVYLIKHELQKFGIDREIVDAYFAEETVDDKDTAVIALQTKWRQYQLLDSKNRYKKAINFLLRRGFSYDQGRCAIAKLEEKG